MFASDFACTDTQFGQGPRDIAERMARKEGMELLVPERVQSGGEGTLFGVMASINKVVQSAAYWFPDKPR